MTLSQTNQSPNLAMKPTIAFIVKPSISYMSQSIPSALFNRFTLKARADQAMHA